MTSSLLFREKQNCYTKTYFWDQARNTKQLKYNTKEIKPLIMTIFDT